MVCLSANHAKERKIMKRKLLLCILAMATVIMPIFPISADTVNAQAAATGPKQDIEVMSYNILTTGTQPITATNAEGTKTRGQMLTELIDQYQPDSFGFNEVTTNWESYLESNVINRDFTGDAAYAIAGLSSDSGLPLLSGSTEYSLILYRSDKYEVEREGGYWFSNTPDAKTKYTGILDGSGNVLYAGMTFERVFSYAVLKDKATGLVSYIHINAHLDHKSSDYVNRLCVMQLKAKADELKSIYQCPIVMTGDYNANEASDAYNYLASGDNGYVDAKYLTDLHSKVSSNAGYGTSYNASAIGVIDHIFVSNGDVGVYRHDMIPNPYLSDHSCVYARLSLNDLPSLDSITIDGLAMEGFSAYDYSLNTGTDKESIVLGASAAAEYTVSAEVSGSVVSAVSGTAISVNVELQNGDNPVKLCVENEAGIRTIYTLEIYKSFGDAIPIISEIFPNADPGYKYFEVTNVGTKAFNTADYYFLWGNIVNDTDRTWEGVFEPVNAGENEVVDPGETVVFWFTYGGAFADHTPKVADFNAKYGTGLTDSNVIISDVSVPLRGYSSSGAVDTAAFHMGSNRTRGMRIAKAKDEFGNYYSWTDLSVNKAFNGPTVSISSYNGLSAAALATTQLYKFKYVGTDLLTAASDLLESDEATPGIYDPKLGNEMKDAYHNIEGEGLDQYSVITPAETEIGNTKADGWAFYSNVVFGDTGAKSAVFYGSVKGSNAAGNIEIYIDGTKSGDLTGATMVGTCRTTATAPSDWMTYQEFTCNLNQIVTGTHNVTLKFVPAKMYVINLDYFRFIQNAAGPEITTVDSFKFYFEGNELTEAISREASITDKFFTLSAAAAYTPADAAASTAYTSNNLSVASIDRLTGQITVTGAGNVTFTATVYSNSTVFTAYTTPIISFRYGISAYKRIEAEWASVFTNGVNISGAAASANKQYSTAPTGMSSNVTEGFNLIGNTVNLSTAQYNAIDFGDGGITGVVFNMALRTDRCIGTAQIYLANPDGTTGSKIGYCTVTAADATDGGAGNYNTYKNFQGVITDSTVTGVHNIIIKFITDVYYVGNIDYFYFKGPMP